MKSPLTLDLERLKSRAYHRAEWADGALRRYHAARLKIERDGRAAVAIALRLDVCSADTLAL